MRKKEVCKLLEEASSALYYAYDQLGAGTQFEKLSNELSETMDNMKCPRGGKAK